MLKKFTQYILGSERTQSGIDFEDDDVDIINGVVVHLKKNGEERGEPLEKGGISEKGTSNIQNSQKAVFVSDTGEGISIDIQQDNSNFKREFEANIKEIGAEKEQQGNGDSLEKVAGLEEVGAVQIPVSKGRTRDISGFWLTLQSAGRAKRTIEGYQQDIKQWQKYALEKGHKTVYNLKTKDIEGFIAKKDVNTSRRLISSLKQLSKWYLRDGFPALNIEMQKLMSAKGKKRIPLAKEPAEFIRIRNEAKKMIEEGDRRGLWISLKLMCGLRISEIATVEVSDNFIQVIGKGDKQRRIPAPLYVVEGLKTIPATGRGGYKKSRFVIDRCLRKLGYTHLHSLRHTYATYLLHKGVKIEVIQKLLGHSSIATTQIYAQTKIEEGITNVLEQ